MWGNLRSILRKVRIALVEIVLDHPRSVERERERNAAYASLQIVILVFFT